MPRVSIPVIEAHSLRREFGDEPVIHGLDLTLEAGATLVVLGPNGAGKSTLLRMLATLLRPSAGSLAVLGAELPRQAHRARGAVGFLAHEPLLYRDLTLAEALAFHADLHGVGARDDRIADLIGQVGLERRRDQLVRTLSAGQLQRAAVCRCVLHQPELLLLDEPGSHLDPAGLDLIRPLIGSAPGRTRVIVTHDVVGGLAEADRALVLDARGGVAYSGAAADVGEAVVAAVYAGAPR